MNRQIYTVRQNFELCRDVYKMVLSGDCSSLVRPGQFINIKIDGLYLRRPISVCDWNGDTLEIIYKVVGRGTEKMSHMQPGQTLDILCGLGNGFDFAEAKGKKSVLIGGGVGVPPLIGLARKMAAAGCAPVAAVLGFSDKGAAFGADEFEKLGIPAKISTVDGSAGTKGFVTDILKSMDYDYYLACGPQAMLAAVHGLGREGQLSFEERMGCGFGACMGCSCKTLVGNKRVCVDGPVFKSSEVSL